MRCCVVFNHAITTLEINRKCIRFIFKQFSHYVNSMQRLTIWRLLNIRHCRHNNTCLVYDPNFDAPSHTAIADTVAAGAWRDRLSPLLAPPPVAEPGDYYEILAPHAARIDIWQTEYLHLLEGDNPVKEWTKGTRLKPFLDALDEPGRSAFEADYAARARAAYPRRADGRTLFAFRRLFIVAVAP